MTHSKKQLPGKAGPHQLAPRRQAIRGGALITKFLALGLAGLLLASSLGWSQEAPPFQEPKTGVAFPGSLGPLKLMGVKRYQPAGLGLSVGYMAPGPMKADIYLYDADLKNLGTGLGSPQVHSQFGMAKEEIFMMGQRGHYRSVQLLTEDKADLATPAVPLPMLRAVFTYSQAPQSGDGQEIPRVSYLLVTAYRDSFLKIRFTFPESQKEQGEQALKQFLAELGQNLK